MIRNKKSAKFFLIGTLALFALMMLIPKSAPIAYAQQAISGRYSDGNVQIDLPEGWSGAKLFDQIAILSPGGFSISSGNSPEAIMAIMSINRLDAADKIMSSEFARLPSESSGTNANASEKCQNSVVTYEKMGQNTVLHVVEECKDDGGHYSKTQVYGILSLTKFIIIAYVANSASAYDKYVNEFETSVKTAHIDEQYDFKSNMITLTGANKVFQLSPVVKGNPVNIKIETSSKVSNFQVSEGERKISFRVEGTEGTKGVLIMPLQQLMEGPYQVSIDGNPATDYLIIEDKTTGEKILNLSYHHSAHDVVITGGTVIPEFPFQIIATLGAMIGTIVVISRVKSIRSNGF